MKKTALYGLVRDELPGLTDNECQRILTWTDYPFCSLERLEHQIKSEAIEWRKEQLRIDALIEDRKLRGGERMTTYANRGMQLEGEVESSNISYWLKGIAVIQKVATPFKPIRDREGKMRALIPEKKSTVDFIGCLNGRGIAFDAKETNNRTNFPLENVKEHQVQFLEKYRNCGGHAFLLIRFVKHQETFILPTTDLLKWWHGINDGGRKSIPHDWFYVNCEQVHSRNGILIDYLHPILTGSVTA